jgi:uncharacterized protein (TIRG00374 family)
MIENEPSRAQTKVTLQFGAGIAVGAFFLWLTFRGVDISEVSRIFSAISREWIVTAVITYFAALFLRIIRWWLVLRQATNLRIRQVATALLTGYAVNALLPARLGELFRADFCRRQYGASRTVVLGTIMLERFTDGIIVLCALALGIATVRTDSASLSILQLLLASGVVVFGALGITLALLGSGRVAGFVSGLLARYPFLAARFRTLSESMRLVKSRRMVGIILMSILIWLADGAAQWCILHACGVSLDIFGMCLVIGVVSLSTLLPSPPGFLGTMQFAFVLSVTTLGFSAPQGLAAALANQIFLLGSMVAVGLTLLLVTYSRRFTTTVRPTSVERRQRSDGTKRG